MTRYDSEIECYKVILFDKVGSVYRKLQTIKYRTAEDAISRAKREERNGMIVKIEVVAHLINWWED